MTFTRMTNQQCRRNVSEMLGGSTLECFRIFFMRNNSKFFAMNTVESAYDKHFLKQMLRHKFFNSANPSRKILVKDKSPTVQHWGFAVLEKVNKRILSFPHFKNQQSVLAPSSHSHNLRKCISPWNDFFLLFYWKLRIRAFTKVSLALWQSLSLKAIPFRSDLSWAWHN